jgi:hypothetical protein
MEAVRSCSNRPIVRLRLAMVALRMLMGFREQAEGCGTLAKVASKGCASGVNGVLHDLAGVALAKAAQYRCAICHWYEGLCIPITRVRSPAPLTFPYTGFHGRFTVASLGSMQSIYATRSRKPPRLPASTRDEATHHL